MSSASNSSNSSSNNSPIAKIGARLTDWRQRAIESDLAETSGDPLGPIASRIRAFSTKAPAEFKTLFLKLLGVLLVSQVGVTALKGASRTVRAAASGVLSFAGGIAAIALAMMFLGRYVRVGIARYRLIAGISAALLGFIILTGSAVRLTGSGLGCPDWPTCKEGDVVPASGTHAQIEFGNRLVTGLCLLAAAIGVLTALVRRPYRRDLVKLGLLVSFLLFSNAIVGGLTVLYELKPQFVMSHFLLAIASLTVGLLVFHRSGERGGSNSIFGTDRQQSVSGLTVALGRAVTVTALAVVVLGTILTGSGPHGGDPGKGIVRFGFSMRSVVKLHSGAVWLMLATVVALAIHVARAPMGLGLRRRVTFLVGVVLAQGAIGYLQWFNQVPALLVQIHIVGATVFWVAVMWVRAGITRPVAVPMLNESRRVQEVPSGATA
jgi:heme a synthase